MKLNYSVFILLTAISLLSSCKKLVDVEVPPDRIDRGMVFTNDATALSAVAGLYTQMIRTSTQFSNSAITIYAGLYSDELYTTATSASVEEYYNNALLASNGTISNNLWLSAYQLIFQANNIIEGLATSTGVSMPVKKQLEGEAKFVRAFCHFYLLNLFGDIPLITSTDYRVNSMIPRIASAQVYDQIIADLNEAKSLMADAYPSASRVRPNSFSASALLARVYLYKEDWTGAETEATRVINEPSYALAANPANVFLIASGETIWQLMPTSATINTWEGNVFIPGGSTAPLYPISNTLVSAFSSADTRKANWIKTVTIGTTTYNYPFKYKVKTSATLSEYYVVLRLAEQYLIRAEARARQNKVTDGKADLNVIRLRAGLSVTTATDQPSLLQAIESERRLEFFAEWGHRLFDLKRTGRAGPVLTAVKPGWNPTDSLFPIPSVELNRNPALTQNPGY